MTDSAQNILIIVAVVIIVGLGSWFYFRGPAQTSAPVDNTSTVQTNTNPNTTTSNPNNGTTSGNSTTTVNTNVNVNVDVGTTKEFTVVATNFSFDTKEIRVKKGDKVVINFSSQNGSHNFSIDQYGIKSNILGGNESQKLSFTADRAGTFEFYCSVGNHRAMGMKGNLIVE